MEKLIKEIGSWAAGQFSQIDEETRLAIGNVEPTLTYDAIDHGVDSKAKYCGTITDTFVQLWESEVRFETIQQARLAARLVASHCAHYAVEHNLEKKVKENKASPLAAKSRMATKMVETPGVYQIRRNQHDQLGRFILSIEKQLYVLGTSAPLEGLLEGAVIIGPLPQFTPHHYLSGKKSDEGVDLVNADYGAYEKKVMFKTGPDNAEEDFDF